MLKNKETFSDWKEMSFDENLDLQVWKGVFGEEIFLEK